MKRGIVILYRWIYKLFKKVDVNDEILKRLNQQDVILQQQNNILEQQKHTLDQILWILKGSENLPIEGVLPQLKRIDADVREMKDWRSDVLSAKGKLDIKEVVKWFTTIGAAIGLLSAIYFLFKDILVTFFLR